MSKPIVALTALALALASAAPAEAIQFSSSSTTGQGGVIIPLQVGLPHIGPVGLDLGVRLVPSLSSFLGPANLTPGLRELTSSLFDANLNLSYHHQLADVRFLGRFNPTIAPFVGYRYLAIPTTEGNVSLGGAGAAVSYHQFGGLNLGVRGYTELPLGFSAYSHLGLTTLTSGGWDVRANGTRVTDAGTIAVGGTLLPAYGVGALWSLFNLVTLSVGYEGLALPTGLRTQAASLPSGLTWINSLSVGARVLFVSF